MQSISELRAKPDLFANRSVFTRYEREHCETRPDRWASLAGILCAKEACLKVLFEFDDLPSLTWLDVEIRHVHGRPIIHAARLLGWLAARAITMDVTISHSGDYAMATVIATNDGAGAEQELPCTRRREQ